MPDNLVKAGVFDQFRQVSSAGDEFWRARDLQPLLGYQTWENFEEAIGRAREAAANSGYPDQFRETTKMIELGKGAKRSVKDYFLSRYACYLIAMNGDPAKPQIAAAQTYFAIQARRQEIEDSLTEDEKRLATRDRVRESNTALNSTASRAGVKHFGFFHDAGYQGMYGMSQAAVKRKKGIAPNEDFLDSVDRLELAANEFRITLTEERIRTQNTKGQSAAEDVHRNVGTRVRRTVIAEIGRAPESLPRAEPLKEVKKRLAGKEPKKLK